MPGFDTMDRELAALEAQARRTRLVLAGLNLVLAALALGLALAGRLPWALAAIVFVGCPAVAASLWLPYRTR